MPGLSPFPMFCVASSFRPTASVLCATPNGECREESETECPHFAFDKGGSARFETTSYFNAYNMVHFLPEIYDFAAYSVWLEYSFATEGSTSCNSMSRMSIDVVKNCTESRRSSF